MYWKISTVCTALLVIGGAWAFNHVNHACPGKHSKKYAEILIRPKKNAGSAKCQVKTSFQPASRRPHLKLEEEAVLKLEHLAECCREQYYSIQNLKQLYWNEGEIRETFQQLQQLEDFLPEEMCAVPKETGTPLLYSAVWNTYMPALFRRKEEVKKIRIKLEKLQAVSARQTFPSWEYMEKYIKEFEMKARPVMCREEIVKEVHNYKSRYTAAADKMNMYQNIYNQTALDHIIEDCKMFEMLLAPCQEIHALKTWPVSSRTVSAAADSGCESMAVNEGVYEYWKKLQQAVKKISLFISRADSHLK